MSPAKHLVFLGSFVHSKAPKELEYLHNAAVGVDDKGTIVGLETGDGINVKLAKEVLLKKLGWDEGEGNIEVREAKEGQFFFPGFIDTHIHASQYPNAGIFGKTTLLNWLETYTFPLESSLSDLVKARRVYTTCIRRTLSHGTTTASYFATRDVPATNLLADLCLQMGQRAFVGRVCMDSKETVPLYYRDETPEEGLVAAQESIDHIRRIDPEFALVSPILTPRFAPSCTDASMSGLAKIQKETGLPVQTHISENTGEIELVAQFWPDSASYAKVYDNNGLLTSKTILAHSVHLSEGEARLIALRKSKVSHCPCSNSCLTSGAARVKWLWSKGIDVGLGTDVSGGFSPSILEAARQAALVSRHVAMSCTSDEEKEKAKLTVEEVLYLATRGGAKCVGLEDKIGGFEVGMEWDAQLVGLTSIGETGLYDVKDDDDDGNVDMFGWETWEDRMAKWLFSGDDRNTKSVWVKGRLVHARR